MNQAIVETEPANNQIPAAEPPLLHWRRNFAANFIDILFFSLALAFASMTTIMPVFLRQLGASALIIGLVPALVQAGQMLPPLFAAPYITPLERKLPFLLKMTLGERIPFVLLAILCLTIAPRYPLAMIAITIALLAIFGLAGGICVPAWMDIVARVTPARMRGKLFGWSGALSGLLGVGGGLAAERVLAAWAFPFNFAACFAAASVCLFVSFLGLMAITEPAAETKPTAIPLKQYIRQLPAVLRNDRDFTLFILVRILAAFGAMALAFVAIFATEQRGLPESLAGRFTAYMLGTQVLTTPLFGMLADRYGFKLSMQASIGAQAAAMGLAGFATTPFHFSLIFMLIGASMGLLFSTSLNIVVEFAAAHDRVTYIGLHGTLIAPAILLAPLIGGWLVQSAGYIAAFAVAGIFGACALFLLTFAVPDPRQRYLASMDGEAK